MKQNKRKLSSLLIILLLFASVFFGVLVANGGSLWASKKYVSFNLAKREVDSYTMENAFYDLEEYQHGLDSLNLKGINLTAYEILDPIEQSYNLQTTLKINVIFSLEKNYNWKELIAGEQKVEYELTIDKRKIINKQKLFDYVQESLNEQEYVKQKEMDAKLDQIKEGFGQEFPNIELQLVPNTNIDDEIRTKWLIDIDASIDLKLYRWDDGIEENYTMKNVKVTKDISILVYEKDIEKELNDISENIKNNFTENYSINEVIQEIDKSYSTSLNEKLKGTYILNQKAEYKEKTEDGFDVYTIKIKIGLDNEYKWDQERNKEVKEFILENIKINTKIVDLNIVINDLNTLTMIKFENTNQLEKQIQELSKPKEGYELALINKEEKVDTNFIAIIEIILNEGYVWNDQDKTNEKRTVKLVLNK